jgi:hypothetical protein
MAPTASFERQPFYATADAQVDLVGAVVVADLHRVVAGLRHAHLLHAEAVVRPAPVGQARFVEARVGRGRTFAFDSTRASSAAIVDAGVDAARLAVVAAVARAGELRFGGVAGGGRGRAVGPGAGRQLRCHQLAVAVEL